MTQDLLSSKNTLDIQISDDILDFAENQAVGELHFFIDPTTKIKAIIAIHDTTLGPALGGCRFIEYPNTKQAIKDAVLLAKGMTYKSALANLPLGGGKAVIIKPPYAFDREAFMHEFGKFIEILGGRYVTALDSGSELSDMDIIAQHTKHVASLSHESGNPAPFTALGVLYGIETAVAFHLGKTDLSGLHVAIQGVGEVGGLLAEHLFARGVRLTISDTNPARAEHLAKKFAAKVVAPDKIYQVECDVFSPCALGGIINDLSIPKFQTAIIAGGANNQLQCDYHGELLHEKGILYATDYAINAGGIIYAGSKYLKTSPEQARARLAEIPDTLMKIFSRSKAEDQACNLVADELVREKLAIK